MAILQNPDFLSGLSYVSFFCLFFKVLNCVVPENIHTSHTGGTGNSEGEGGVKGPGISRGVGG